MKLLIAEDQRMLRDALYQLLMLEDEVSEVYTAKDGCEALEVLKSNHVDVALVDIEMPHYTGLDVLEWCKKVYPNVKVVILTTFKRPGYFERAVAADVDAFVLKERSVTDLMQTIRRVLAGQKEYSPELVSETMKSQNPLTKQEKQLVRHMSRGLTSRDIAQLLHLSEGTVRNYTSTVLHKLNAANRTDAVRIVQEKGWDQ